METGCARRGFPCGVGGPLVTVLVLRAPGTNSSTCSFLSFMKLTSLLPARDGDGVVGDQGLTFSSHSRFFSRSKCTSTVFCALVLSVSLAVCLSLSRALLCSARCSSRSVYNKLGSPRDNSEAVVPLYMTMSRELAPSSSSSSRPFAIAHPERSRFNPLPAHGADIPYC